MRHFSSQTAKELCFGPFLKVGFLVAHYTFTFHKNKYSLVNVSRVTSLPYICLNSIDAFGVDIAPFSAMPDEAEVLLLPCLPLTCGPGDNPESDLWIFNVKSPAVSDESDPPLVRIDYVHPGYG